MAEELYSQAALQGFEQHHSIMSQISPSLTDIMVIYFELGNHHETTKIHDAAEEQQKISGHSCQVSQRINICKVSEEISRVYVHISSSQVSGRLGFTSITINDETSRCRRSNTALVVRLMTKGLQSTIDFQIWEINSDRGVTATMT